MKANELMVGDWVYSAFTEHPCKVEGIEWVESGYAYVKVSGVDGYKCIESLSPIPLVQDILEKNEFEVTRNITSSRNKDVWALRVSKNKVFHITEHYNKRQFPYFWIELGSNSDIKYVHQLQNALHLCGIEKEIIL